MTRISFGLAATAATLGMACSGGGGGGGGSPGTLVGTVHGQTFTINDGISTVLTIGSAGDSGAEIILANDTGLCTDLTAGKIHPSESGIVLALIEVGSDHSVAPPSGPGTFSVFSGALPVGKAADVQVYVTDGSCTDVTASEAKGSTGTVTLSAINGDAYSGSYDVTLDSGDHITGTFAPEACPGAAATFSGSAAPACVPQ